MSTETQLVRALQGELAALGYYRLRIDGIVGPGTRNAIIDFKARNGLRPRDFVGPITLRTLFGGKAISAPTVLPGDDPLWLAEARRLLGTREVPGPGDNPAIMGWARDLDQWYPGDDTPWCGLFVAHCMSTGAPEEPQGFNRLGAREWLKYGRVVGGAPLGGVAVFWRTRPDHWHGHTAFITGQNSKDVRVIGGNQDDTVSEKWFPRSRLLGVRAPHGFELQQAPLAVTGAYSQSEA